MCKERLPDKGSEYEGEGGDINDAIEIIIINLSEMNKLWVRMSSGIFLLRKIKKKESRKKQEEKKERIDLKGFGGRMFVAFVFFGRSQYWGVLGNGFTEIAGIGLELEGPDFIAIFGGLYYIDFPGWIPLVYLKGFVGGLYDQIGPQGGYQNYFYPSDG